LIAIDITTITNVKTLTVLEETIIIVLFFIAIIMQNKTKPKPLVNVKRITCMGGIKKIIDKSYVTVCANE